MRSKLGSAVLVSATFLSVTAPAGTAVATAQMASAPIVHATHGKGLIATSELEKLLPATVYFSGQSAPLQIRNSAAYSNTAGRITWAGLVDTSGYSTGVREKYQFYFVTEVPLNAGTLRIAPGIYGGGFLADNTFVLLDVSGTEIGRTAVEVDTALRRPRPLQMVEGTGMLRLYLGRQYVALSSR
ncbi:hypothetical protein [Terriglobus sp.]|uniref:hypothetical protein n=1 Tax=Terriglobus sp. TaxID=1889013 RepID=UPI003AFF7ABD